MKVRVVGLREVNTALRRIDKEAPKGLRLALNGAAELLIDHVRPQIPRVTGAAAASLKASSTRTSARISVGGRKAPYFPWLDFGGQGRRAGRPAARPFYPDGRYVYPTLARVRPDIEAKLQTELVAVVRDAGLEVS